jgi:hypothetical protein
MTSDGEIYDPRHPSPAVSALEQEWLYEFSEQIQAFRAVRNTIAHAPGNLTDEQARAGRDLGRELLASYRRLVQGIG